MVFNDPKVEFVRIDMKLATATSTDCSPHVPWFMDGGDPSVETCDGNNAPMNNCSTMVRDGFLNG